MQEMMWRDSTASVSGGKGTTFQRGKGYVKKRVTPDEDYDRLAERVWRRADQKGIKIHNQADFISVFETYMKDSNVKGNTTLRDNVFKKIQARHDVSSSLFTSKERVEVFVKVAEKPGPKEFTYAGTRKGARVFARRTTYRKVLRDGTVKNPIVFRDKKGRFVSVKGRR